MRSVLLMIIMLLSCSANAKFLFCKLTSNEVLINNGDFGSGTEVDCTSDEEKTLFQFAFFDNVGLREYFGIKATCQNSKVTVELLKGFATGDLYKSSVSKPLSDPQAEIDNTLKIGGYAIRAVCH